jgi:hypothetical protein
MAGRTLARDSRKPFVALTGFWRVGAYPARPAAPVDRVMIKSHGCMGRRLRLASTRSGWWAASLAIRRAGINTSQTGTAGRRVERSSSGWHRSWSWCQSHSDVLGPPPAPLSAPPSHPAITYAARPKASPSSDRSADTHDRVRHDKISKAGTLTLRVAGHLRHIGVSRPTSSSWPRTCTSESSTPPPENSCASSPSTPAAITNPPATHQDPGNDRRTCESQVRLSPMSGDIALVAGAGFEPATSGL